MSHCKRSNLRHRNYTLKFRDEKQLLISISLSGAETADSGPSEPAALSSTKQLFER